MAANKNEEQAQPPAEVKYKVIRGTDIADLADAVNRAIEQGWAPLGGVAASPTTMADFSKVPHPFMQALFKAG